MARIKTLVLAVLLGHVLAPLAMADTLSIVDEPGSVTRPHRGMNMDQVRSKFGAARQELAPVGEPPITRWVYDDFTVYYEHQYVIHAVVHKHGKSPAPSSGGSDDTTDDDPLFLLN